MRQYNGGMDSPKRENIEVLFVDAAKQQSLESDTNKRLAILEDEINKKLLYLQRGVTNAIGERFSVEIINIQFVSPNAAMITINTRKL